MGSIAAAVTLPFATWFTTRHDIGLTAVTGAMAALAIYKHRLNIQRLIDGTENRIEFKKKGAMP
jgi:glycerol-3-phosphate acyltransferase PlsY